MAKLNSTTLVITASKLVKNTEADVEVISAELRGQLEVVLAELLGADVLIEIEEA
jgi:hypothetical protein